MMKKAVPLSLFLASSALGQNLFAGNWAVNTPTAPDNTAKCCYYTGAVTIANAVANTNAVASSTVTGKTNTQSPASAYDATTPTGPCGKYMDGTIINATPGTSVDMAFILSSSATNTGLSTNTGAAPAAAYANKNAGFTVSSDGLTLSFTPGPTATTGTCTDQTFNRVTTAVTGADGTWTAEPGVAGSATTSNACCFLATGTPVVVATSGTRTTVTARTGTCTTGGDAAVTKILKASGTTGTYNDLSGVNTFTVNADGTITYSPTGVTTTTSSCTQKLTKVPSSGVHLASIMTPVVVGGAMLGLVAV